MVERAITLTVAVTANQPLRKPFPNRFVNGLQQANSPLTTSPLPYRFNPQQLAGSLQPDLNLLGLGTRYVPGVA